MGEIKVSNLLLTLKLRNYPVFSGLSQYKDKVSYMWKRKEEDSVS